MLDEAELTPRQRTFDMTALAYPVGTVPELCEVSKTMHRAKTALFEVFKKEVFVREKDLGIRHYWGLDFSMTARMEHRGIRDQG